MPLNASPVFDAAVLNSLPMVEDGSNPGFVKEILRLFIDETHLTIPAMIASLQAGDMAKLRLQIHTLKSSAAQVGAMALSAEALWQDAQIRSGLPAQPGWPEKIRLQFLEFEQAINAQTT